jgi:S-DNA-T family DNA segregation ATPase FtsK/SpoIIIE
MARERWDEITGIILFAVGVIVFLSLVSYTPDDLKIYTSLPNIPPHNYIRIFGAYLSGIINFLFGYAGFFFPVFLLAWAITRFLGKVPQKLNIKIFSTIILAVVLSALFFLVTTDEVVKFRRGGFLGYGVSLFLVRYFGKAGAGVILFTFGILSVIIATEFLLSPYLFTSWNLFSRWIASFKDIFSRYGSKGNLRPAFRKKDEVSSFKIAREKPVITRESSIGKERPAVSSLFNKSPEIKIAPLVNKTKPKSSAPSAPAIETASHLVSQDFKLPALELLDSPPPIEERKIKEDLEANARILEDTLRDFNIEVKVVRIERGPVVTLYELQPAPGVKITRISSLSDDIALVMKASSVRVVAPLPGRGTVGVEVPNSTATVVYLKEILETKEFRENKSRLSIALGKDIAGNPLISDLQDMPHLLIAGATGSGKTVCVNALLMSILFRCSPEEVRFLLIDPKMVELAMFNGLPHLLCPVVTDAKKTSSSLAWLVEEMEMRYRIFARVGVRNIEAYNEKIRGGYRLSEQDLDLQEVQNGHMHPFEPDWPLAYIVVIIDELADLMLVASREIEEAITRLAQLSRAVGIHLILATQRPSVDVITGVIKANFPARISFQVASKVDSRTVLDMNGADKLLGKGDMLFLRPGTSKPIRAQGSLVSDREIERVAEFLKKQRQPEYNAALLKESEKRLAGLSDVKDELYDEAVKVILETGQASASILQRRLRLGYTRAARLVDMMEQEGIVGPPRGAKPREIFLNKEDVEQKGV